jgi:hypothetical protein
VNIDAVEEALAKAQERDHNKLPADAAVIEGKGNHQDFKQLHAGLFTDRFQSNGQQWWGWIAATSTTMQSPRHQAHGNILESWPD